MSRLLVVIPVRGGSKGVPRKNLREVAGRPLLAWTVSHALELRAVDPSVDVVVSTDDPELADVALAAGAEVPFLRPAALAEDTTATEPVVEHAIEQMTLAGREPEHVMLLQATSPIRLPGTLVRAREEYLASDVDSMVGVVPHPPFVWHLGDGAGAAPRAEYDVAHRLRRQDMSPRDILYRETGSVYVTATWVYREHHNRLAGRIGLFVMDEVEGVDIDTEADLRSAGERLTQLQAE